MSATLIIASILSRDPYRFVRPWWATTTARSEPVLPVAIHDHPPQLLPGGHGFLCWHPQPTRRRP